MPEMVFDGKSLFDFGTPGIAEVNAYNGASRDIDTLAIPGRNGSLTYDNGRYEDNEPKYQIYWSAGARTYLPQCRDYLNSRADNHYRLENGYDAEEYRLARVESLSATISNDGESGLLTVVFDCWPQHFLKSGETEIEITESGTTVTNPTTQEALPLIRVYLTEAGSIMVGSRTVSIAAGATEYVDIDSEIQSCYEGTARRNDIVTAADGLPVLPSGDTGITFSGGVTKVVVTPHWWTL